MVLMYTHKLDFCEKEGGEMSEEQKKQAREISTELNKLTPEMREKALIFMQGMAAMVQPMQAERKEA